MAVIIRRPPPIVDVPLKALGKQITLVVPFYENDEFLRKQVAHWRSFMPAFERFLRIIIVDDCSPSPAEPILLGTDLPLRLLRMMEDHRWGWLAARNRGVWAAMTEWVLVTDMDHMLPLQTLHNLVYGAHNPAIAYRFSRVEHGQPIKVHQNSYFMTKARYWHWGGHDEALLGYYGTDGDSRRRIDRGPHVILRDVLDRHENEGDSSTTRYGRKEPQDRAVQRIIAKRGPDWKPKVLSVPWVEIPL